MIEPLNLSFVDPYSTSTISWGGGVSYFMSKAFSEHSTTVNFIPVEEKKNKLVSLKWYFYTKLIKKTYHTNREPSVAKNFSSQIERALKENKTDAILSLFIPQVAYLKSEKPLIIWTDATFNNLINFYPEFTDLCPETVKHGHLLDRSAIEIAKMVIFTSEWAAKSAIEDYGADPNKVKVISYGANIDCTRTVDDIEAIVQAKPRNQCNLLFLGVDWYRKGGDIALEVATQLNQAGLKTQLTVIGSDPVINGSLPVCVKRLGYINKLTLEGQKRIEKAFAEAHFLILPSRAECYGIVFCEAASFGVPSISTLVGGIPTAIKSEVNGQLFKPDAYISDYCQYISDLFDNYSSYKSLAISSFHEYESRLNWSAAVNKAKQLINELI